MEARVSNTSEQIKSVVVIARCKLLASVKECELHKLGPSLQLLSIYATIDW